MSRVRKRLLLLLSSTCLGLVALIAGCTDGENGGEVKPSTRRIILLTNGNSPYWDAFAAGAKQAEEKLDVGKQGLKVVIDRGNFSPETQIDKLRQYQGATDIAAVAICVTDPKNQALVNQMVALSESGVKLITVDSDINRDDQRARKAR
ncbi:MAG: hypothetical protein KDA65_10070, partial [Planctomycetaceae bacterium]|nr:hypothetical protein [Planctomycetaceae bacterium]